MDPITIVAVGTALGFGANYILQSMDDGVATLCYQPAPLVRVCEDVPKSELDKAVMAAIEQTNMRTALANGQIVE